MQVHTCTKNKGCSTLSLQALEPYVRINCQSQPPKYLALNSYSYYTFKSSVCKEIQSSFMKNVNPFFFTPKASHDKLRIVIFNQKFSVQDAVQPKKAAVLKSTEKML